jgi:quercetin dioxygenase-like cupin family protein
VESVKHNKGWGYELWIVNNEKYCGKILHFESGKKCSYHYHKLKTETFYLQKGKIQLTHGYKDIDDAKIKILNPGDSFHAPIGLRHQMLALEESDLFEFSTTHYESDSHRILLGD